MEVVAFNLVFKRDDVMHSILIVLAINMFHNIHPSPIKNHSVETV